MLLADDPSADSRVFFTAPMPYEKDGIKFLPFVDGVKGRRTIVYNPKAAARVLSERREARAQ